MHQTKIAAGVRQQGGAGGKAPCLKPAGGLGGAVSPQRGPGAEPLEAIDF